MDKQEIEVQRFLGQLIATCKMLGDADIESDDHGDRWLSFRANGFVGIWGEVRARYNGNIPIWEITIGGEPGIKKIVHKVNRVFADD